MRLLNTKFILLLIFGFLSLQVDAAESPFESLLRQRLLEAANQATQAPETNQPSPPQEPSQPTSKEATANTVAPWRPGARWFVHDQQKCDAALAELPQALSKIRAIRVAGFSTEPAACLSQELLNQCTAGISEDDSKYHPLQESAYTYFAESRDIWCKLGDSRNTLQLKAFTTLNNGLVITSVSYKTQLETTGNFAFYPTDALYKSLVARYGEPILIKDGWGGSSDFKSAQPPYQELVWADGAITHYAMKRKDIDSNSDLLQIALEIKLSPALYEKFRDQFRQRDEMKRQEEQRNAPVPKF